MATIAVFIALGSASYAAFKLPKNSVGAKQLKKNAVSSAKVKDHSLKAVDFTEGQLSGGAQGPPGPKGDPGATNVVVRYGETSNVPNNSVGASVASCRPGEAVTGGGWSLLAAPATNNYGVLMNGPAAKFELEPAVFEYLPPKAGTPATAWKAELSNGTGYNFEFVTYVICASP